MSQPQQAMSGLAPALDVVRYAEVLATIRYFGAARQDEVLARLSIPRDAWTVTAKEWTAARDGERSVGKTELTERFGAALAETRARLARERPAISDLGPLPDTLTPAESASAPEPEQQEPAAAEEVQAATPADPQPAVAVPSFVLAERARGHLPKLTWQDYAELTSLLEAFPDHRGFVLARYNLTNDDVLAVSDPFEQAIRADANLATSFRAHVAARRASLVATSQPTVSQAVPPATQGTIDIDEALAARAATPFRDGPAVLPPSASATPRSYETAALTPELLASARGTPFDAPATQGTVELDASVFAAAAAVPFRPATSAPPTSAPASFPAAPAGETRELSAADVGSMAYRPSTPFTPPSATATPSGIAPGTRREVEAIAGLRASIDVNPAGAAALLRSIALDPARFEARGAKVDEIRASSPEVESIYQRAYERSAKEERG